MELRNHPVMVCDGVRTWPPKWLHTYGQRNASVTGEVGLLTAVFLSRVTINRVLLIIHTDEGNVYIGALMFEKADSARAVFDFLYSQRHKPLAAIGALDLPENFAA